MRERVREMKALTGIDVQAAYSGPILRE